jgi:hypothetical protein
VTTADYIKEFVKCLPESLRPDKEIPSLNTWLLRARKNGWSARELAQTVATGANYNNASSPIGLMVAVVERTGLTERKAYSPAATVSPTHCLRSGCACTHEVCVRGWIDGMTHTDQRGRIYEATAPCPTCRPELYRILDTAPSREAAMDQIKNR